MLRAPFSPTQSTRLGCGTSATEMKHTGPMHGIRFYRCLPNGHSLRLSMSYATERELREAAEGSRRGRGGWSFLSGGATNTVAFWRRYRNEMRRCPACRRAAERENRAEFNAKGRPVPRR